MFSNAATPTLAAHVLLIPEILLNIFSFITNDDRYYQDRSRETCLARCARVCSAWCAPANVFLYKTLNITWRIAHVNTLIRSLDANPSHYALIKSCEIKSLSEEDLSGEIYQDLDLGQILRDNGYDWFSDNEDEDGFERALDDGRDAVGKVERDLYENHEDRLWMGVGLFSSTCVLVKFLERLTRLKHLHLAIEDFYESDDGEGDIRLSFTPETLWIPLIKVLQGLDTLVIESGGVVLAQQILSASTNLISLTLKSPRAKLEAPLLTQLRHLSIDSGYHYRVGYFNLNDCGQCLETLIISDSGRGKDNFFPPTLHLPNLTHLHLHLSSSWREKENQKLPRSIFRALPHLRHFSMNFHGPPSQHLSSITVLLRLLPDTVLALDISFEIAFWDKKEPADAQTFPCFIKAVPIQVEVVRMRWPRRVERTVNGVNDNTEEETCAADIESLRKAFIKLGRPFRLEISRAKELRPTAGEMMMDSWRRERSA